MSNGIFNFNFLAFLPSEILGESQIYTRGLYAPRTPPVGEFVLPKRVLHHIQLCFNFNIQSLVVSKILGGPKFTLVALSPPLRHLVEIFFYPRRVRYYV